MGGELVWTCEPDEDEDEEGDWDDVECAEPPEGMMSWWPGDGDAKDIQGGNDGTLVNGTAFAPGMVDRAFRFDGLDDYVSVPHDSSLDVGLDDLSVDFWVRLISPEEVYGSFVEKMDPDTGIGYFLFHSLGSLCFGVGGDSNAIGLCLLYFIDDSGWHHMAFTLERGTDTDTVSWYVNGVLAYSGSFDSFGSLDNDVDLRLGYSDLFGDYYLDGLLDEVEIFDRLLSETEIQAIVDAAGFGKCKDEDEDTD